jgi:hypothetical protein
MTRHGWWAGLVMMAVGAGGAGAQGPASVPPLDDTLRTRSERTVVDTSGERGPVAPRFGGPTAVTRPAMAPAPASRQALVPSPSRSQARAMMIVGAAGLVAGAVIDDDAGQLIMIGSAIVGLYGLYHFLQ